jgi:hypothetical protein
MVDCPWKLGFEDWACNFHEADKTRWSFSIEPLNDHPILLQTAVTHN